MRKSKKLLFQSASRFNCSHFLLDKCGPMWYNRIGIKRAADDRQGPNFRPHTPYANFSILLADFSYAHFFPENSTPYVEPAGPGRAYRDPGTVETFSQFYRAHNRVAAYARFPRNLTDPCSVAIAELIQKPLQFSKN